MTLEQFWTYDFNEIKLLLESYKSRQEIKLKENLVLAYQMSTMTAMCVGASFSGNQPPKLSEIYPDLFETEHKDMSFLAAQFASYAKKWNKQRASMQEGANDS